MRTIGTTILVGITALVPYTIEKGVSPIELYGVVRLTHSTPGNSSGHLPLVSLSLFFMLVMIVLLVDLACLLACGC